LPAYTFTYGDGMHLTNGSNGRGGSVTFAYESWHESIPVETWPFGMYEASIPRWGNPLKCHFQDSRCDWVGVPGQGIVGGGTNGFIRVLGLAEKLVQSYQPGRWYRIVAGVKSPAGNPTIQLGYRHRVNGVLQADVFFPAVTLTSTLKTIESDAFFLPRDTTSFAPRLNTSGSSDLYWYYLMPMPTYARVTSRTLSAGGSSYTFNYTYQNPVMNTTANSDAADTDHPFTSLYTEFRGHANVVETDPYGKQVTTHYGQTDCDSGKSLSMITKNASGITMQSSSTSYSCTETTPATVPVDKEWPFGNVPFTGIVYRWTPTASETSNVRDVNGATAAFKTTDYVYNGTYGNLTQKTVSGTDIDTTDTYYNYAINTIGGKWLVGLLSRTYVKNAANVTLSLSMNLYDNHLRYNDTPDTDDIGELTGTRTMINGTDYSQTSMTYDTYGNMTSQKVWTEYGPEDDNPPGDSQISYTCYGSGGYVGGLPCTDDYYHSYVKWTRNAKLHVSTVTYDYALGVPLSETDPNGAVTSVTYDDFGRFTSLSRPGDASPTLNVSYQNNPFIVTLEQTIEGMQKYTVVRNYDGLGRQTSTVTNDVTIFSTYDAYGNVLMQSMPHASGNWFYITTTYDALGRPVTVTAPDGTSTDYAYNGLTTTVTDAKNHSTTSVTDILGRTLSVTPPTGPGVTYNYDELGNLLTAARGGATVTLTYDKAGRKLTMDDPDMGFWRYGYNALGNMIRQVDARNKVTCLYYDNLNRLRGKDYLSGAAACPSDPGSGYEVTYNYDAGTNGKGRRTSMVDVSGSTTWYYDPRGRVWKETKVISGTSFTTEWTYNLADLPVTMKYPDNEIVTTQYNNNMQPTNVSGADNYVPSMTYDSAGRLLTRAMGNGLTQNYHFYEWNEQVNNIGQGGRLEALTTGSLQNLAYVYDKVGNIMQITNSTAAETSVYEYDALDRLTSWQLNQDSPETYTYDAAGRLDQKASLDLQYLDANHIHAVTNANSNTYVYDNNGNQTTRTFGSDHFDLVYDAENHLVEVQKNDVTIAEFTYDGDGKRVMSVMDGETILFVGGYYERKGSEITKYYMAGATRVAMRKYTIPQSMTVEYMLGDHLGSTSITTDLNGTLVSEMRYKPWGELRFSRTDAPENTTPIYELTRYLFTGQYSYDVEFGLKYYGARFYDSTAGHFVSADTKIPSGGNGQEWDRFAYAFNNPLKYSDPTGHDPYWLGYIMGTAVQYLDDISLGVFSAIAGDPDTVDKPGFQEGRDLGRAISTTQAIIETVTGVAMIEAVASTIAPTVGGGLACSAVSGGTCAIPAGIALGGEIAVGLEGTLLAGHGGAMLARVAKEGSGGQYGGHTISKSTLEKLGLTRDEAKTAIESMKDDLNIPNDFHGTIMDNGDYIDPETGEVLGNLYEYTE
jgi:RHS repeat-associated protein